MRQKTSSKLDGVPEGDALHRAALRLQPLVGQRLEVESPNPRGQATGVARRSTAACSSRSRRSARTCCCASRAASSSGAICG